MGLCIVWPVRSGPWIVFRVLHDQIPGATDGQQYQTGSIDIEQGPILDNVADERHSDDQIEEQKLQAGNAGPVFIR